MFDEQGFTKEAKAAGVPDKEIQAIILQERYKQLPKWKQAAGGIAKALPLIFAGVGGLAGLVTPFTPVGGAAIGAAGGSAAKNSALDLLGMQTKQPGEQVAEAAKTSLGAGLTAGTLATGIGALFPGQTRSFLNRNTMVPEEKFQETMLKVPDQQVTGESARNARELGSSLYSKAYPYQTQTGATGDYMAPATDAKLNDIYKLLNRFEKETGAYKGNQAATDISNATRTLGNQEGAPGTQLLNKYMSAQKTFGKPLTVAGLGAGGLALLTKWIKDLMGNK